MNIVDIRDRDRISAFLADNTPIHIYGIGDLDDPYWPHTTWYAAEQDDEARRQQHCVDHRLRLFA